jgi:hypothetical protein
VKQGLSLFDDVEPRAPLASGVTPPGGSTTTITSVADGSPRAIVLPSSSRGSTVVASESSRPTSPSDAQTTPRADRQRGRSRSPRPTATHSTHSTGTAYASGHMGVPATGGRATDAPAAGDVQRWVRPKSSTNTTARGRTRNKSANASRAKAGGDAASPAVVYAAHTTAGVSAGGVGFAYREETARAASVAGRSPRRYDGGRDVGSPRERFEGFSGESTSSPRNRRTSMRVEQVASVYGVAVHRPMTAIRPPSTSVVTAAAPSRRGRTVGTRGEVPLSAPLGVPTAVPAAVPVPALPLASVPATVAAAESARGELTRRCWCRCAHYRRGGCACMRVCVCVFVDVAC